MIAYVSGLDHGIVVSWGTARSPYSSLWWTDVYTLWHWLIFWISRGPVSFIHPVKLGRLASIIAGSGMSARVTKRRLCWIQHCSRMRIKGSTTGWRTTFSAFRESDFPNLQKGLKFRFIWMWALSFAFGIWGSAYAQVYRALRRYIWLPTSRCTYAKSAGAVDEGWRSWMGKFCPVFPCMWITGYSSWN